MFFFRFLVVGIIKNGHVQNYVNNIFLFCIVVFTKSEKNNEKVTQRHKSRNLRFFEHVSIFEDLSVFLRFTPSCFFSEFPPTSQNNAQNMEKWSLFSGKFRGTGCFRGYGLYKFATVHCVCHIHNVHVYVCHVYVSQSIHTKLTITDWHKVSLNIWHVTTTLPQVFNVWLTVLDIYINMHEYQYIYSVSQMYSNENILN